MMSLSEFCVCLVEGVWADDLVESATPELQAKIRRVIEQGHIDAEDFNGVSLLLPSTGVVMWC